MIEDLGTAVLNLETNLETFRRNMRSARHEGDGMQGSLDALAAVSKIAKDALESVKMQPGQAAESKASAEGILSGVRGVSDDARTAARELDRVKLTEGQAAESKVAAEEISGGLNQISRNADQAKRKLAEVRLAGGVPGRSGVGVGPFGSGFGRVGLLGAAVGAGTLLGPAAGPAGVGLLAAIPAMAGTGVGALGTLALAFHDVGKAIGGDKKAFDSLVPAQKTFVLQVRSLSGWLDKLKQVAAGGLFPGLTAGLHSALSSGTVAAITTAIRQFASAIGQAGAAWGKYFGSAQFQSLFGPLMQAGARNLSLMSDAALHLFDALGVLGRAAIPLMSWITRGIDSGSRFAAAWLRAKDATGGLAGAMDEAKTSLRLVGGLFVSLLRAVGSLGRALYPVSKVAVKDLTDGLNALAGIIDRNKDKIREIVGGALAALVSTVKTLAPLLGDLVRLLDAIARSIGGWKTAFEIVIGGFLASKFVTLAGKIGGVWAKLDGIGPRLAGIGTKATLAEGEVGGLRGALLGLGAPEVLAAIAAAAAAFALYKAFTAQPPTVLGPSPAKGSGANIVESNGRYYIQTPGGRLTPYHGPLPESGGAAADSPNRAPGYRVGDLNRPQPGIATPYLSFLLSKAAATATTADDKRDLSKIIGTLRGRLRSATTLFAKTQIQDAINSYAAQLKALTTSSVFGADPPFTKNLGAGGKPSVIPTAAAHQLALASANANRASVLGNAGAVAQGYLKAELGELGTADKLLKAKYEGSTGKARTQLFAAITSVENKMRTVRQRMKKALTDSHAAELALAVDVAKNAVASATVGTAAYDKAVAAEAKALRAEIAYWDKRSKNLKLSIKTRDQALRAEIADKKTLAHLLHPSAAKKGTNEAQFLSSFADIITKFAPNAFPASGGNGKTDTHLYDIKTELRQQTPLLKDALRTSMFPASDYGFVAAGAVGG